MSRPEADGHRQGPGSGFSSMWPAEVPDILGAMPQYVLHHRHSAEECSVAFAAWRGFRSRLRGTTVLCSCRRGGHELWFVVDADDAGAALGLLPPWLGARSSSARVEEVPIP